MAAEAVNADLSGVAADSMSRETLEALARDLFPRAPQDLSIAASSPDEDDTNLDASLRDLYIRRKHGAAHAWAPESSKAASSSQEAAPDAAFVLRIPKDRDEPALLQTIAIKDALLQQMEAAILLPPPDQAATVGLSRRAQALIANARRREALMACKLKALSQEVANFRQRELQATHINRSLKRQLRAALTDLDAIAMRREVRTLRADLSAALAREAALQRELLVSERMLDAERVTVSRHTAHEAKLRDDMDYVRRIASQAMAARAADAMGVRNTDGLWR